MKFAKMFSVILLAIFSFAMSSANAGLCRLNEVGDKCVDQPLQTVKNVGCATVNSVEVCVQAPVQGVGCATISGIEVCGGEKVYNTVSNGYIQQSSLQYIAVNNVSVTIDKNLADRAWNYINATCPKYVNTNAAATFIADMSTPQFNGLSVEGQMFLSACNAR